MDLLTKFRSILTFFLACNFLLNIFIKSTPVEYLIIVLLVIVYFLSLITVKESAKVVGYFLLIISAVLFITNQAPLEIWLQGFTRNIYILVMFTVVPLLAVPIRHGGYMKALEGIFKRYAHKDSQFYLLINSLSFFLGSMINIAAVSLSHQVSQASEKRKNKKLLATSICRGFTASLIWAPSYVSTALALELTGANWTSLFPYGFGLGITAVAFGWMLTRIMERNNGELQQNVTASITDTINWRKILELILFSAVLIALIIIISHYTYLSTIIVVALMSLLFPPIWLSVVGRSDRLVTEFKGSYFHTSLPKLKNETVLFIGAGMLSTSVMYSHLGSLIPQILMGLGIDNVLYLSIFISFAAILIALLGVHPIILITLLGSTIQPSLYNISPTMMAVLLSSSWSLGTTVSPSSANIITMANLVDSSVLEVGPKWNLRYILALALIIIFLLNILNVFNLI